MDSTDPLGRPQEGGLVSTGTIKLSKGEADKLTRYIERNCKPITDADQAETLHWIKRLTGSKS